MKWGVCMSSFRSILCSVQERGKGVKKSHRIAMAATVFAVATGTLVIMGDESKIARVTTTAEAKENPTYMSTNTIITANTSFLPKVQQAGNQKEFTVISPYRSEPDGVVSMIVEETKNQIQETLQEQRDVLERSIEVHKEKVEREKKKTHLTASEIDALEHIVEAEAGDQDIIGRILVANVVMNRVKAKEFPNDVKGVIYQNNGKVYQFSPVLDGSIKRVKISKTTKKAVQRVLNGEDHSKGALYFVQRNIAGKKNLSWFDRDLTRLFKHGCHTFYK